MLSSNRLIIITLLGFIGKATNADDSSTSRPSHTKLQRESPENGINGTLDLMLAGIGLMKILDDVQNSTKLDEVVRDYAKKPASTPKTVNLTSDDTEAELQFIERVERLFEREMVALENATSRIFNETSLIIVDMLNDPCVKNGNSTMPAVFAFVGGIVFVLVSQCCCSLIRRRRRNLKNRRLVAESKKDDLNRLIEAANGDLSDVDVLH